MNKFTEYQIMVLEKERVGCEDVLALLGDYQDNDLPPSLRGRIESHIRQCSQCFEVVRGYRQVVELARELKDPPVPAGVTQRLKQELNKRLGLNLRVAE
jgi:anti-sigma factor RsiW